MKATRIISLAGLKLVEILVFVVILGLLAAIASPNFVSAGNPGRAKTHVKNLDQIDDIAVQFVLESNKKAECLINYSNSLAPNGLGLAVGIRGFPAADICSESPVSTLPACSLGDLANLSPFPQ